MDPEIQQKIDTTVRQVLEESDLDRMTEYKVRKEASERLKMDLSQSNYKAFVRQVVEAFLEEQKAKEDQQAEEEKKDGGDRDEDGGGRGGRSEGDKEYTDDGDLVICRVSARPPFRLSAYSLKDFFWAFTGGFISDWLLIK